MSIAFVCTLLFGVAAATLTHFVFRLHLFGTILISAIIGLAIMRLNATDGDLAVSHHGAAFILGAALTIVGDFLFQVLRSNR